MAASAVTGEDVSASGKADAAHAHMREIHRNNYDALLGYLRRLTRADNPDHAEDLVQETMMRAWRNHDTVPTDPEGQRRWLFIVAHRIAIDRYRMRRSRPVESHLADIEPAASGQDPSGVVIAKLMLRQAIGQLSENHRSVLELYVRGLSVNEIAVRLGIPTGTVRSRTHYAIASLRGALSGD